MKALGTAVALLVLVLGVALVAQHSSPASPSLLKATFGKLPLYFVENRGVYPDEVKYYIQGADKTLFFTRDGVTFRLKGQDRGWAVKLDFVGANPQAKPEGQDPQQAVFSYFKGSEKDWKAGLRTFSKVVYRNVWPGIDLVYKGNVNQLKYEFVVAPGADPAKIRLRYRGAESVATTEGGALRATTPTGSIEDATPVAWQEIGGERVAVEMAYRLDAEAAGDGTVFGFDLGRHDPTHPFVLDPAVLVYCGYIGGSDYDSGDAIAVDGQGNAYVTGFTTSTEATFPVRVGPDLTFNGTPSTSQGDAFVAKVNPQGTALVYCGYIGGAYYDAGYGIAVDTSGHAYIAGYTYSTEQQNFPVTVGPDVTHNGVPDAFVAKVNPQGTALVYCGYIGGNSYDYGYGITVGAQGNAYVVGKTQSDEKPTSGKFPVKVGPDLTYNGGLYDVFVAKVNAAGMALDYCGYIGGSGDDCGWSIALDAAGNAYVTGYTDSSEQTFPVTGGPDLTYNGPGQDAFVAKVNPQGTALVYCGYIGGSGDDSGSGIAVDAARNVYLTGYTRSTEQTFPVTVGPDLTHNGGFNSGPVDAFVAKVNPQGTALVYCGYVGGSGYMDDYGAGIAVDAAGNAYLTGSTDSSEQTFPVTGGPDLTYNGGLLDVFVAKVNARGTGLVYCGYVGGSDAEFGMGIAVDAAGNAYVTGGTESTEQTFPVTGGPDLTYNGPFQDAFVAKIADAFLVGSGAPRPGGHVNLSLSSSGDAGLVYQLGSSLGNGPIQIDTRKIDLSPDGLLMISVGGWWPTIFSGYRGVIDSKGQANAAIHLPNIPALIGIWLHTAFVTLDPQAPSGIRSISDTFSFPITK